MTLECWFTGDQDDNSITYTMLLYNYLLLLPELLMHAEQKEKDDELIRLMELIKQQTDFTY